MATTNRYRFLWDFGSAHGSWEKGDEAEFDDDTATHINNESPGVLEAVKAAKAEPEPDAEPEPETRAADQPPHDRQVKAPSSKRST